MVNKLLFMTSLTETVNNNDNTKNFFHPVLTMVVKSDKIEANFS